MPGPRAGSPLVMAIKSRTPPRPAAAEPLEARRLLAAGDLDASFAAAGLKRFDFDAAHAVQVLLAGDQVGGGDLLVGGYADAANGGDRQDFLARLNADGSLDNAFDGDGVLALPADSGPVSVYQIVGLGDGDALVLRGDASGNGGTVARYNPDGSLDAAFADNGTLAVAGFVPRLALLPGGGFVLAGTAGDAPAGVVPVQIYGAGGSPRGSNFQADLGQLAAFDTFRLADVAVDAAGRVYLAGDVSGTANVTPGDAPDRAGVFRLDNDLSLDDGYGAGGEARRSFAAGDIFFARSLAIDAAGRAVLDVNEDDGRTSLVRFTTSGLIDAQADFAFAAGGPFNATNEVVRVLPLPDGKLLVGGYFEQTTPNGGVGDAALARLNADLSPDDSFGDDTLGPGQKRYDLGTDDDRLAALFLADDATAVAVGRTAQLSPAVDYDATVFRVQLGETGAPPTDPPPTPDFATLDADGLLSVVGTDASETITLSTEGREVVVTRTPAGGTTRTMRFADVADVTSVTVNAAGGNDSVSYRLLAPSTLLGGAGSDTLGGGPGRDVLSGGPGDDSLLGNDGDDSLLGGNGNDTLAGGAGDDTLDGGAGDEALLAEPGADRYVGGAGNDSLSYAARTSAVTLTAGVDADDGEADEGDFVSGDIETLTGGTGDDTLAAAAGTRVLSGGAGDDTFTDAPGDQQYLGGAGNDTFVKLAGNDTLAGGDGDDRFVMADAADGNDSLDGGAGDDAADYGPRSAPVRIDGNGDGGDGESDVYANVETYVGGGGDDTLGGGNGLNGGNPVTLIGGGGDDTLLGRDAPDLLLGGDGRDAADFSARSNGMRIVVGGDSANGGAPRVGDDVESVLGGNGDDTFDATDSAVPVTLMGGGGNDTLLGGAADDLLVGGDGDDSLAGGAGLDRLVGGAGADFLDGGGDNDKLVPGLAGDERDTVVGGDGFDLVDYRRAAGNVRLVRGSLGGPASPDSLTPPDPLAPLIGDDVELAFGGGGDDLIRDFLLARGGPGNDRIVAGSIGVQPAAAFGGPGDDTLSAVNNNAVYLDGGEGNDTLRGAFGRTTLVAGLGVDTLEAGLGDNTLVLADAPAGVSLDLRRDNGTDNVLVGGAAIGGIYGRYRDVLGTPFADRIVGNDPGDDEDGANYLNGGDGDDTLLGGGGKDVLVGGAGSDSLDGGDDYDFLHGFSETAGGGDDAAANTLFGGNGFDVGFGDDADDRDVERFVTAAAELANLL